MCRIDTSVDELYAHTGTGNPSFVAQDPLAPLANGVRCPRTLVAVTTRPPAGTAVYMFFSQEAGVTYTWRAGFYCAHVFLEL